MLKQVLINVEATDMRIAVLEDGELAELFVEHCNAQTLLGNIYKGRVEGIVPGLKAVFVNIGFDRNAFLHFSDVLHEYDLPVRGKPERLPPMETKTRGAQNDAEKEEEEFAGEFDDEFIPPPILPDDEAEDLTGEEEEVHPKRHAKRSRTLHVGDSILIQVIKEPINAKGPRVTSYVSVPGRYLVMMPFSEHRGGVSRKIDDPAERRRLRDLLGQLNNKDGSFIIRTAGLEEDEAIIHEDHEALIRQWRSIKRKNNRTQAPALIHNEQNILQRIVRDVLRNDIDEILIDSLADMKKLIKACESTAPRMVDRIHFYESSKNIFDVFEVEQQFQKALRRRVWLKSGGVIVIDETEALTAIDVNSGKYVGSEDQKQVILKTNLEACHAVSRQLRLRDIGGLIVIDFIDMTLRDHQHQVLRELKRCLRKDNAKFSMTSFSEFGLVEMTRKRVRMSLANVVFQPCPYCEGSGKVKGEAEIWKNIKYEILDGLTQSNDITSLEISLHPNIQKYLEKETLAEIKAIANRFKVKLNFTSDRDYHLEQYKIVKQMKSVVKAQKRRPARKRGTRGEKSVETS